MMSIRSCVAIAVTMAYCAGALSIPCARSYTVQAGDTCDAISAAQDVSSFQLATANLGRVNDDCTNLFPGEVICLQLACVKCDTVHVFQDGESCSGVAAAAGTDVATLIANNPNINSGCTNVHPGEVLCVASSVLF
ncbi:hypothetical protein HGRIS_008960 [Hohenbuehelia grisea]|uniref:LysM domain-containing protein n=1 Tax=Hohenbuehelia grisea TaxID=104357 RepID=A0ABR3IZQ1_9AGAR